MRLDRHVKIITSQLENLQHFKDQLEKLLGDVINVIKQGQCWIDEEETTQSFTQINEFLSKETSNCLNKCLHIAKEDDDIAEVSSKNEENITSPSCNLSLINSDHTIKGITMEFEKTQNRITRHSRELRDLKRKINRQEKHCKKRDQKTEIQFQEIMTELQTASDFMSGLQKQTEILNDEKNEHEKKLESLIGIHPDQESDLLQLQTVRHEMEKSFSETVQQLKRDAQNVSLDLFMFKCSSDEALANYVEKNEVAQNQIENQDGLYVFYVNIMSNDERCALLELYHKDDFKLSICSASKGNIESRGYTAIFLLKQSDEVYLKTISNSLLSGTSPGDVVNTFHGFLLAATKLK